jgi:pfkB family carbohydrate kinase
MILTAHALPAGAVTYAAAVAQGLQHRACIITTAGRPEDAQFWEGHHAHVMPTNATLTFRHTYTWFGQNRRLQVTEQPAHVLRASDVPLRCRLAKVVLVGPLTATDVNSKSFMQPDSLFFRFMLNFQHQGLMAQGLQRQLDKQGHVKHAAEPSARLLSALTPDMSVFLSDVETDPWPAEQFHSFVVRVRRLIVTRGARGVSAYSDRHDDVHVPAERIKPVDTNGAGDTFATGYMLSLAQGKSAQQALVAGTWMASRVCLQPQECKPACCTDAVREQPSKGQQAEPQRVKPALFAEPRPRPEDEAAGAFV